MIKSRLCELIGMKYPIIQAGMGPFPTTNLAIAAANAGALGIVTTSGMADPEGRPEIYANFCASADCGVDEDVEVVLKKMYRKVFEETRAAKGIFGVNVMVSEERVKYANIAIKAMLEMREEDPEVKERFKVLFTSAGDPMPWGELVRQHDLVWIHIVPSVKAAKRCKKAGVNVVVASGHEGGFHTSWEPVHSMILLPAVVDEISDENTLVCGAGGYCDGKTLAAALVMGADGVQMGTRFLATQESDFSPLWKQTVVETGDRGTLVARGLVGPARWIVNERSKEHARNTVKVSPGVYIGEPDGENEETLKLIAYENAGITAALNGDKEKAMMAAGESAQRVNDMPTVNDMVQEVMREAEEILTKVPEKLLS